VGSLMSAGVGVQGSSQTQGLKLASAPPEPHSVHSTT
jgi:hypothetical protein